MNQFAAAFGLTVACTILVPATSVAGARPDAEAAIVLTADSAQPFVVSAAPGSETKVFASINNGGNETRTVRLAAVSDDPAIERWVTIANTIIDISGGVTTGIDVRVAIPAEATAASHAVTITATLDGDPAPAASLTLPISVLGAPKGALQIASVSLDPRASSKLVMKVRNDGALSVTATGELRVGRSPEATPIAVAVVVGPSTSESVEVDIGRSVKLPANFAVELRYGTDVASWSGTLRPVAAARAATRPSAVTEPATNAMPRSTAGLEPAAVLLVFVVGAAIVWLLFELFASKRASPPNAQQSLVVGADIEHAAVVAAAIGAQLAPLVDAIEHLAAAFTQRDVVPINTVERYGLADLHHDDGQPIQEKMMTDSDAYFADEIYGHPTIAQAVLQTDRVEVWPRVPQSAPQRVPLDHDGVQALSEIESATSIVREAYLRPELDTETQQVIEAQLVADDAHHRAELIEAVASGLGIPKAVLLEWMPDEVFDRTEIEATAIDVVAIQRENRVLELQVAILKRAVAHFASS